VQFLLTICFLVCKYPHVTNIINDVPVAQISPANSNKEDNEKLEIQKVTYIPTRRRNNSNPLFEPLNTQAITLVNPNLFDKEQKRLLSRAFKMTTSARISSGRSNESASSREESVSSSPLAHKSVCDSPSMNTKSGEQWEENCNSSENKIDEHLQNLRDLRLDCTDCNIYDDGSYAMDNQSLKSPVKMSGKSRCFVLDTLMSYLNSAVKNIDILEL